MSKRILLGCYEIPGYGGASTASYKLFEMMQEDGYCVHFLNLIDEEEAVYYRYIFGESFGNPKRLNNVYNCVLNGSLFNSHPELSGLINNVSPDIIVGIGYIAALIMKQAVPEKPSILITSGCQQAKVHIAQKRVKDIISLIEIIKHTRSMPVLLPGREVDANRISDLVITHSDMTKSLYQYFLPHSQIVKMYSDVIWFAEWIYKDALYYSDLTKPFLERDIDVLFVASTWNRPEKNYKLVKKIVSRCKSLNVHIVGETEIKFANVKHHGLITRRKDVFELLGRTKTIVCPSLFDTAPGILYEASAMDCNIIASKNCGNWQICNKGLLVDPFNLHSFLEKISHSLHKKYEDNIDYFLNTNSYKNLVETIMVF